MGIVQDLTAGALGGPAGLAVGLLKDVLDRVTPDPELKKAAQAQAFELITQGDFAQRAQAAADAAQSATNTAEAQTGGTHFRDGAGWVCVAGFALVVLRPVIEWGCTLAGHPVTLPQMDMQEIGPMLAGLLGLGGMHTAERIKGAA